MTHLPKHITHRYGLKKFTSHHLFLLGTLLSELRQVDPKWHPTPRNYFGDTYVYDDAYFRRDHKGSTTYVKVSRTYRMNGPSTSISFSVWVKADGYTSCVGHYNRMRSEAGVRREVQRAKRDGVL